MILDKYSDIGWFITNTFLQNIIPMFFFRLGFINMNWAFPKYLDVLPIQRKIVFISSSNNHFLFWKMLIVEHKHTGGKERNIVFQKWRGKHYRKWTWSVGFQRKKYCSKCANIHFHLGEKPFQRKLSIDKEKLLKMCQHSFSPFQRKLSIDKELHQLMIENVKLFFVWGKFRYSKSLVLPGYILI